MGERLHAASVRAALRRGSLLLGLLPSPSTCLLAAAEHAACLLLRAAPRLRTSRPHAAAAPPTTPASSPSPPAPHPPHTLLQERGIKNKHFSCLDQLNPVELRRMFMDGRSKFARGCLNEPFRILSGLTDEEDLAALSSAAPDQGWQLTAAMALTLQHLAQCVPVVLERPESLRLMRHYFPQLTPGLDSLQHANALKVGRCPLSDATRSLLAELSVGEHILYEAVQRRVDYMLAELGEEGEQQQEEEQR